MAPIPPIPPIPLLRLLPITIKLSASGRCPTTRDGPGADIGRRVITWVVRAKPISTTRPAESPSAEMRRGGELDIRALLFSCGAMRYGALEVAIALHMCLGGGAFRGEKTRERQLVSG